MSKDSVRRSRSRTLLAVFSVLSLATLAQAQAAPTQASPSPTFSISGAVSKPEKLTVGALEAHFASAITKIDYETKDKTKHTSRAIPLLTLLQAAGPLTNPNIKHHDLQFVVAVRGFDGYAVDFSMAELSPSIGNRSVWIALDVDGKPFVGEDGPVELIVPSDVKPARWVHGVVAITVIDGAAAAKPLAMP